MTTTVERIETQISPDFLDTIGRTFKFKHSKGVAEWLKNSLDHYLRLRNSKNEPLEGNWPVLLCAVDGTTAADGPNLAVVDFGGTTFDAVESFFLLWGSSTAATHGGLAAGPLTGGHGNGGKFYMREMWRNGSRLLTWRDGCATSLVVDKAEKGSTGIWELRNEKLSWLDAISFALQSASLGGSGYVKNFVRDVLPSVHTDLEEGTRGFTVIVGRQASAAGGDVVSSGKWRIDRLLEEIRTNPQARRPIRELSISVFHNGTEKIRRLGLEPIVDDDNWDPVRIDLLGADVSIESLADAKIGKLVISKSATPLTHRHKDLNSITVTKAGVNTIGFYPISQLPVPGSSALLNFLYGELELSFDGVDDIVENDRERLVANQTTQALIVWMSNQIGLSIQHLEEQQRSQQRNSMLRAATELNEALNKHTKNFLEELQTDLIVDIISDPAGGGPGKSGDGNGRSGNGSRESNEGRGSGGSEGSGGSLEVSGSTQHVKRPKFPQILLTGIDLNPADSEGRSKLLTDRHPPLDQDDTDKQYNVWWINTSHPYANAALERGGPTGFAFKSHQLAMFRDVVQREWLRIRQRHELELGIDVVENTLSEASDRFLSGLPHDLVVTLLGDGE